MESRRNSRPCLEKQEEFEVEDEGTAAVFLSPVTIQIEDRGGSFVCEYQHADSEESCTYDDDVAGGDESDIGSEKSGERKKAACRMKLLVRSQAVNEDASPPPDLESVIANTNMLSVTNAPSFVTQSKGTLSKSRLGNQSSSQGSTESSSTSGISRDSSTENYSDSSGLDLQQFIIDTLHKNQKDRMMLLKIEQELLSLIKDTKKHSIKFPQMSSYNRMLVHRVSAFFGLDHYVDGNGTSVIVNKTKNARIPDTRFQEYIKDELLPEEPKKSILKRDSISFEEEKERSPERQSSTDSRRSKSFEEREEEYEKARARIFNQDEGIGGSPLNRSQEGPEDVRWSSEMRPWSSTDSESSNRPAGPRIGSSFENESTIQGKVSRSFVPTSRADSDKPVSVRTTRPVMTKASSFGGISVLAREGSSGRTYTPKITKAESFNVTSISDSSIITCDMTIYSQDSHIYAISPFIPADHKDSSPSVSAQDTCPVISIQPLEVEITSADQPAKDGSGSKELTKEQLTSSHVTVPLMWPYSTGAEMLFTDVSKHFQAGYQKIASPAPQVLAGTSGDQVPTSAGQLPTRTAPSSPSHVCHPHSPQVLPQIQPSVNTSSPATFYAPYGVPSKPIPPHLSPPPPRPFLLVPMCYLQQTSNVHTLQQVLGHSSQSSSQSSGISSAAAMKNHTTVVTTHLLNTQCMSCFQTLAHTSNIENASGTSTTIYPHVKSASSAPMKPSSSFPSQLSQPAVCLQQSMLQFQTPTTLPPVYVSVTSSTQSPAIRTHAGGHATVQFSTLRSQSLPVQSNSGVSVLHPAFNSGTGQFLGYTVYAPPAECVTAQSPLTIVTMSPNTSISAQAPQFVPAYMSAYQILQTNVPSLAATSTPPLPHLMHSEYPAPICSMSKMPVSFPLVKQASDPGIAEHAALASNIYFVAPPVQHPILLPPQPRFRAPSRCSIKPRKQRSKGGSSTSQTILEGEGCNVLEVDGYPDNIKQADLEKYLSELGGAQLHFLDADNLKSIDVGDELITRSKHKVLAVFASDKEAQDAMLKTSSKFQLRLWTQECKKT